MPREAGPVQAPRTSTAPRDRGLYERGGIRGTDVYGRSPVVTRTPPAPAAGSPSVPAIGSSPTIGGSQAVDSPVFADQRARTRSGGSSSGQPHTSSGQPHTNSGSPARATPRSGDRSRDNRSAIGNASPRTHPPYTGDHGHNHYGHGGYYGGHYGHYYYPNYWWGYAGFGLGYFYYDPYWWGYPGYYGPAPYPYYGGAYGYGTGGSYGPDPGYAGNGPDPSYGAGSPDQGNEAPAPGYGSPDPAAYGVGNLHLKVSPRDAQVYVDGHFVGLVDDFDGFFQRLTIDSGSHRIEIRKPGFATLSFDVRIPPDETVTYRGELQPVQ
jgi:hypothetical protein